MIKGSRQLTEKICLCDETFNTDRDVAIEAARKIIAEHYDLHLKEVQWRDFRRPGWHIDPPGRFFIKNEPLHLYIHHYLVAESEE